jgi:hypothetical protein
MNLSEKRSPELISKYFDLLRWKNNEYTDKTADEIDNGLSQELQSIKQELGGIQNLTTEKDALSLSTQKEIDSVNANARLIKGDIETVQEKIFATYDKINEYRQKFPKSKNFSPIGVLEDEHISTIDLNSILLQLITDVREDIKLIWLDIWQAVITPKPLVLLQYSLIPLVVVVLTLESARWVNLMFYPLIILYIVWKILNILKRPQKMEIVEVYETTGQKTFEAYLRELEQHNEVQKQHLNQTRIRAEKLTAQLQLFEKQLNDLAKQRNKLQNRFREIEDHKSQLKELHCLDELTSKWLKEDIDKLISTAKGKLDLTDKEYVGESGALKMDPIRAVNGCTSKTVSPKLLVEDESEKTLRREKILVQYSKDVRSEYGYNDKARRYGIYEFQTIFICENFLSSYKCYYNFIRDKCIDEEYCEYLYDSIVFTKIQEQSSISMQGSSSKTINSKRLTISTNDGKLLSLQIGRSGVDRALSSQLLEIDRAATEIRITLRQRELSNQE